MKVYVVRKYDDFGYWENIKCYYDYDKAFNFAKQIIIEHCEYDEYAEVEDCLESLKKEDYVEELIDIDEVEVVE